MDKNTLSNYGWIVVAVLVLSVMIALATPFGHYVELGAKNTLFGLISTSDKAMDATGLVNNKTNNDNTQGETPTQTNKIPADATYIKADGTTLTEGNDFPELSIGDTYIFGDYEYRYGYVYEMDQWVKGDDEQNGWGFHVLDIEKTAYGEILQSINNASVTHADFAFYECANMETPPKLPDTIVSLYNTYFYCVVMTTVPEIPQGVTDMRCTFCGCESIVDASNIVIPEGVTSLSCTFSDCYLLEYAPVIPEQVTYLNDAFCNSPALKELCINCNPTEYNGCIGLMTKYLSSIAVDLVLDGNSDMLVEIANTRNRADVFDKNGNLLN